MLIKYPNGVMLYRHKKDKNWKVAGPGHQILAIVKTEHLKSFCELFKLGYPEELAHANASVR